MKEPLFSQNNDEMASDGNWDKLLDQILKTDTVKPLPEDFADRVAIKAVKSIALKQSLTEFLIYAGVILFVLLTFLVIICLLSKESFEKWTDFLVPNFPLLAGIALVLFYILFMDRVLLPQLFYTHEKGKSYKK